MLDSILTFIGGGEAEASSERNTSSSIWNWIPGMHVIDDANQSNNQQVQQSQSRNLSRAESMRNEESSAVSDETMQSEDAGTSQIRGTRNENADDYAIHSSSSSSFIGSSIRSSGVSKESNPSGTSASAGSVRSSRNSAAVSGWKSSVVSSSRHSLKRGGSIMKRNVTNSKFSNSKLLNSGLDSPIIASDESEEMPAQNVTEDIDIDMISSRRDDVERSPSRRDRVSRSRRINDAADGKMMGTPAMSTPVVEHSRRISTPGSDSARPAGSERPIVPLLLFYPAKKDSKDKGSQGSNSPSKGSSASKPILAASKTGGPSKTSASSASKPNNASKASNASHTSKSSSKTGKGNRKATPKSTDKAPAKSAKADLTALSRGGLSAIEALTEQIEDPTKAYKDRGVKWSERTVRVDEHDPAPDVPHKRSPGEALHISPAIEIARCWDGHGWREAEAKYKESVKKYRQEEVDAFNESQTKVSRAQEQRRVKEEMEEWRRAKQIYEKRKKRKQYEKIARNNPNTDLVDHSLDEPDTHLVEIRQAISSGIGCLEHDSKESTSRAIIEQTPVDMVDVLLEVSPRYHTQIRLERAERRRIKDKGSDTKRSGKRNQSIGRAHAYMSRPFVDEVDENVLKTMHGNLGSDAKNVKGDEIKATLGIRKEPRNLEKFEHGKETGRLDRLYPGCDQKQTQSAAQSIKEIRFAQGVTGAEEYSNLSKRRQKLTEKQEKLNDHNWTRRTRQLVAGLTKDQRSRICSLGHFKMARFGYAKMDRMRNFRVGDPNNNIGASKTNTDNTITGGSFHPYRETCKIFSNYVPPELREFVPAVYGRNRLARAEKRKVEEIINQRKIPEQNRQRRSVFSAVGNPDGRLTGQSDSDRQTVQDFIGGDQSSNVAPSTSRGNTSLSKKSSSRGPSGGVWSRSRLMRTLQRQPSSSKMFAKRGTYYKRASFSNAIGLLNRHNAGGEVDPNDPHAVFKHYGRDISRHIKRFRNPKRLRFNKELGMSWRISGFNGGTKRCGIGTIPNFSKEIYMEGFEHQKRRYWEYLQKFAIFDKRVQHYYHQRYADAEKRGGKKFLVRKSLSKEFRDKIVYERYTREVLPQHAWMCDEEVLLGGALPTNPTSPRPLRCEVDVMGGPKRSDHRGDGVDFKMDGLTAIERPQAFGARMYGSKLVRKNATDYKMTARRRQSLNTAINRIRQGSMTASQVARDHGGHILHSAAAAAAGANAKRTFDSSGISTGGAPYGTRKNRLRYYKTLDNIYGRMKCKTEKVAIRQAGPPPKIDPFARKSRQSVAHDRPWWLPQPDKMSTILENHMNTEDDEGGGGNAGNDSRHKQSILKTDATSNRQTSKGGHGGNGNGGHGARRSSLKDMKQGISFEAIMRQIDDGEDMTVSQLNNKFQIELADKFRTNVDERLCEDQSYVADMLAYLHPTNKKYRTKSDLYHRKQREALRVEKHARELLHSGIYQGTLRQKEAERRMRYRERKMRGKKGFDARTGESMMRKEFDAKGPGGVNEMADDDNGVTDEQEDDQAMMVGPSDETVFRLVARLLSGMISEKPEEADQETANIYNNALSDWVLNRELDCRVRKLNPFSVDDAINLVLYDEDREADGGHSINLGYRHGPGNVLFEDITTEASDEDTTDDDFEGFDHNLWFQKKKQRLMRFLAPKRALERKEKLLSGISSSKSGFSRDQKTALQESCEKVKERLNKMAGRPPQDPLSEHLNATFKLRRKSGLQKKLNVITSRQARRAADVNSEISHLQLRNMTLEGNHYGLTNPAPFQMTDKEWLRRLKTAVPVRDCHIGDANQTAKIEEEKDMARDAHIFSKAAVGRSAAMNLEKFASNIQMTDSIYVDPYAQRYYHTTDNDQLGTELGQLTEIPTHAAMLDYLSKHATKVVGVEDKHHHHGAHANHAEGVGGLGVGSPGKGGSGRGWGSEELAPSGVNTAERRTEKMTREFGEMINFNTGKKLHPNDGSLKQITVKELSDPHACKKINLELMQYSSKPHLAWDLEHDRGTTTDFLGAGTRELRDTFRKKIIDPKHMQLEYLLDREDQWQPRSDAEIVVRDFVGQYGGDDASTHGVSVAGGHAHTGGRGRAGTTIGAHTIADGSSSGPQQHHGTVPTILGLDTDILDADTHFLVKEKQRSLIRDQNAQTGLSPIDEANPAENAADLSSDASLHEDGALQKVDNLAELQRAFESKVLSVVNRRLQPEGNIHNDHPAVAEWLHAIHEHKGFPSDVLVLQNMRKNLDTILPEGVGDRNDYDFRRHEDDRRKVLGPRIAILEALQNELNEKVKAWADVAETGPPGEGEPGIRGAGDSDLAVALTSGKTPLTNGKTTEMEDMLQLKNALNEEYTNLAFNDEVRRLFRLAGSKLLSDMPVDIDKIMVARKADQEAGKPHSDLPVPDVNKRHDLAVRMTGYNTVVKERRRDHVIETADESTGQAVLSIDRAIGATSIDQAVAATMGIDQTDGFVADTLQVSISKGKSAGVRTEAEVGKELSIPFQRQKISHRPFESDKGVSFGQFSKEKSISRRSKRFDYGGSDSMLPDRFFPDLRKRRLSSNQLIYNYVFPAGRKYSVGKFLRSQKRVRSWLPGGSARRDVRLQLYRRATNALKQKAIDHRQKEEGELHREELREVHPEEGEKPEYERVEQREKFRAIDPYVDSAVLLTNQIHDFNPADLGVSSSLANLREESRKTRTVTKQLRRANLLAEVLDRKHNPPFMLQADSGVADYDSYLEASKRGTDAVANKPRRRRGSSTGADAVDYDSASVSETESDDVESLGKPWRRPKSSTTTGNPLFTTAHIDAHLHGLHVKSSFGPRWLQKKLEKHAEAFFDPEADLRDLRLSIMTDADVEKYARRLMALSKRSNTSTDEAKGGQSGGRARDHQEAGVDRNRSGGAEYLAYDKSLDKEEEKEYQRIKRCILKQRKLESFGQRVMRFAQRFRDISTILELDVSRQSGIALNDVREEIRRTGPKVMQVVAAEDVRATMAKHPNDENALAKMMPSYKVDLFHEGRQNMGVKGGQVTFALDADTLALVPARRIYGPERPTADWRSAANINEGALIVLNDPSVLTYSLPVNVLSYYDSYVKSYVTLESGGNTGTIRVPDLRTTVENARLHEEQEMPGYTRNLDLVANKAIYEMLHSEVAKKLLDEPGTLSGIGGGSSSSTSAALQGLNEAHAIDTFVRDQDALLERMKKSGEISAKKIGSVIGSLAASSSHAHDGHGHGKRAHAPNKIYAKELKKMVDYLETNETDPEIRRYLRRNKYSRKGKRLGYGKFLSKLRDKRTGDPSVDCSLAASKSTVGRSSFRGGSKDTSHCGSEDAAGSRRSKLDKEAESILGTVKREDTPAGSFFGASRRLKLRREAELVKEERALQGLVGSFVDSVVFRASVVADHRLRTANDEQKFEYLTAKQSPQRLVEKALLLEHPLMVKEKLELDKNVVQSGIRKDVAAASGVHFSFDHTQMLQNRLLAHRSSFDNASRDRLACGAGSYATKNATDISYKFKLEGVWQTHTVHSDAATARSERSCYTVNSSADPSAVPKSATGKSQSPATCDKNDALAGDARVEQQLDSGGAKSSLAKRRLMGPHARERVENVKKEIVELIGAEFADAHGIHAHGVGHDGDHDDNASKQFLNRAIASSPWAARTALDKNHTFARDSAHQYGSGGHILPAHLLNLQSRDRVAGVKRQRELRRQRDALKILRNQRREEGNELMMKAGGHNTTGFVKYRVTQKAGVREDHHDREASPEDRISLKDTLTSEIRFSNIVSAKESALERETQTLQEDAKERATFDQLEKPPATTRTPPPDAVTGVGATTKRASVTLYEGLPLSAYPNLMRKRKPDFVPDLVLDTVKKGYDYTGGDEEEGWGEEEGQEEAVEGRAIVAKLENLGATKLWSKDGNKDTAARSNAAGTANEVIQVVPGDGKNLETPPGYRTPSTAGRPTITLYEGSPLSSYANLMKNRRPSNVPKLKLDSVKKGYDYTGGGEEEGWVEEEVEEEIVSVVAKSPSKEEKTDAISKSDAGKTDAISKSDAGKTDAISKPDAGQTDAVSKSDSAPTKKVGSLSGHLPFSAYPNLMKNRKPDHVPQLVLDSVKKGYDYVHHFP